MRKLKKLTGIVMAVAVTITSIQLPYLGVTAQADEIPEYSDSSIEPAAGTTYKISSKTSLEALADAVNGGKTMAGVTFRLDSDIVLNSGTLTGDFNPSNGTITPKYNGNAISSGNTPKQWTPIGISDDTPFSGEFDGNGHTISGMYIDNSTDLYAGLFGCVVHDESISSYVTIRNLNVINSYINNESRGTKDAYYHRSGLIAGSAYDELIINCHTKGNVSGYGTVGGVVGASLGVYSCSFEGNVRSASNGENCSCGGVVGESYICNSYAKGNIYGVCDYVGGLVGAGMTNYSYFDGNVYTSSSDHYSVISGHQEDIGSQALHEYAECFYSSTSKLCSNGTEVLKAIDDQSGTEATPEQFKDGTVASALAQGTKLKAVTDIAGTGINWVQNINTDSTPYLSSDDTYKVNTVTFSGKNYTTAYAGANSGKTVKIPSAFATADLQYTDDNGDTQVFDETVIVNKDIEVTACTPWNELTAADSSYAFSGGTGESSDPYKIATAADLRMLALNVNDADNEVCSKFNDKYYILTRDITLNQGAISAYLDSDSDTKSYIAKYNNNYISGTNTPYIWDPIGVYNKGTSKINKVFSGNFDGNGHSVKGVYFNDPSSSRPGLFGQIENATIKNVNISNSVVIGMQYCGGVAGYISKSADISGCSFAGAVMSSTTYAAGMANNPGNVNATFTDCCNKGSIYTLDKYSAGISDQGICTRCMNSGGIYTSRADAVESYAAGIVSNGKASYCINTGYVYGSKYAAGIVAQQGSADYCINTGNIYGDTFIGGISGDRAVINKCYATGNVYGNSESKGYVGIIIGCTDYSYSVSNSYYLGTTNINSAAGTECTSLDNFDCTEFSAEQLKSGELAYILKQIDSGDENIWGQKNAGSAGSIPTLRCLESDAKQIFKISFRDSSGNVIANTADIYGGTGDVVTLPSTSSWKVKNGDLIDNNQYTVGTSDAELWQYVDTRTDISRYNVTIDDASIVYDGKAKTPSVTVTSSDKTVTLTVDDYTAEYTNNTESGKGNVTVTGKGAYKGSASASFDIQKASQNSPSGLVVANASSTTTADGKISNVNTYMEYYMQQEGTDNLAYTKCTGNVISNLLPGTYYVRYAENANYKASGCCQLTVKDGSIDYSRLQMLDVEFGNYDYEGTTKVYEKCITIKNIDSFDKTIESISMENGSIFTVVEPENDADRIVKANSTNEKFLIRVSASLNVNSYTDKVTITYNNGSNTECADCSLTIDKVKWLQPVGLTPQSPVFKGDKDGAILGTDSSMEYSTNTNGTFIQCTGDKISGLAAGTYYVRKKADANHYASDSTTVTVMDGTTEKTYSLSVDDITFADETYGYASLSKEVVISSTGNTDAVIDNVTVSGNAFRIDSSNKSNLVAAKGTNSTYRVVLSEGLDCSEYSGTITVTYNNGATATANVYVNIEKANQNTPAGLTGESPSFKGEKDGRIKNTKAAMEYSSNINGPYSTCSEPDTTGLAAGTYYVRLKGDNNHNPSEAAAVEIAGGPERSYTLKVSDITFDPVEYGYSSKSNIITIQSEGNSDADISDVIVSGSAFSIDKSSGVTGVIAGKVNTTYNVILNEGMDAGSYEETITVTYNNNQTATATVRIEVSNAIQNKPEGLQGINVTVAGLSDGKISNTTVDMEYSDNINGSYTTCSEPNTTGLTAGTYYVRLKAKTNYNASEPVRVIIGTGSEKIYTLNVARVVFEPQVYGYATNNSKSIKISSSGNADATITSVAVSGNAFEILNGTNSIVSCGQTNEDYKVILKTGLSAGKYEETITVTYNDGATASEKVSADISKAPQSAPAGLAGKTTSFKGEKDGIITGTNSSMEYSSDGIIFTSCIGDTITGLSAGEYNVRMKSDNNHYAGDIVKVTITDGPERTYILNADNIEFGSVKYGYSIQSKVISLTNAGNSNINISDMKVNNSAFIIDTSNAGNVVETGQDKVNNSYIISLKSGLLVGDYNGVVTIKYNDNNTISFNVTAAIIKRDQSAPVGVSATLASGTGIMDGKITGTSVNMEYSSDGKTFISCTGDTVTGLAAGEYYVRYKGDSNSNPGESVMVIIGTSADEHNYSLTVADVSFNSAKYGDKIDAANIIIANNGTDECEIKSVNVSSDKFIIIYSAVNTVAVGDTNNTYKILPASNIDAGQYTADITVTYDKGNTAVSKVRLTIEKADRNAPSGLTSQNASTNLTKDGRISGVSDKMEYSTSAAGTFTKCTGNVISGLAAGQYYIRYSEDNNYMAGETTAITVSPAKVVLLSQKLTVKSTSVKKVYGSKAFSLYAATNRKACKLKYSTSDKKVVTVSSTGKVTIKGNGQAVITITSTGKGYQKAVKKVTITVIPKKMSATSLKTKASTITATWKKDTHVTGYQLQYSTNSKFKSKLTKTITFKKYSNVKTTIKKLKKKSKYYVRIRSYKKYGKKQLFGSYSKAKYIIVK